MLYELSEPLPPANAVDDLWIFEADVCDPLEMIPCIRSYICRIVSLQSDHPYLVKRFKKDLAAMWKAAQERV